MRKTVQVATLAILLTACAGPSAVGQPPASDPEELGRLHLYEVPLEDVPATAQAAADSGWIEVTGVGTVEVSPDRARVSFAMETRAEAADAAADANAEAMTRVIDALRGADFPGLDLSTFGYALRPEYALENDQRTRRIVAYTVLNNIAATIEDVASVGRLIDTAIRAGANRVGGISFYREDTEAARREALAEAVRTARAEAEVIAAALGRTLGAPLEIRGGADRPQPRTFQGETIRALGVAARAADTPIEEGDQTVTANVWIRFALGPESGD
jgi:uncharacterized protein YggE